MADENKDKPKKEVLDLLDGGSNKPSRRERQRVVASKVSTVENQKKEALDLGIDDDEKSKRPTVRKTGRTASDILPSISKIRDMQKRANDAEFSKVEKPASKESEAEPAAEVEASVSDEKVISIKPPIIVNTLAEMMGLKGFQIMADLIKLEVFVAPNQAIEPEIAEKVCEVHGFVFEREKREKGGGVHKEEEVFEEPIPEEVSPEDLMVYRAPIITFMGHVDHGKTSLLDYIRKTRVTSGEAGGITQHVAAYRVDHEGKPITFIDTPGHAIFSEMRSRGADVTDIVVLVVAADDSIMPQTEEAITHAKNAGKTIIVAINKCDLPAADPTRVKTDLMKHGINPVDFGGDVETVEVSAMTGMGMDDLLDLMALQAEVLELKANPKANARAAVIEARVQAGKGPTASVIIESGTLKVGQPFICGPFAGKVKSMIDDFGNAINEAGPAMPVEVLGFAELPHVGDAVVAMESDRAAKKLSEERLTERREKRLTQPRKRRMEDMLAFVGEGDNKIQLNIILKTDVQGSVEAIRGAIADILSDKVEANIITGAAGAISESDILLASSSNAVVLGFNVKVESKAVKTAKAEGVQVKLYSIVYELIDQVRESMLGKLDPMLRETVIGHADCKQVFKANKGRAAGCIVRDGKIRRKAHARVMRGKIPVFDGKMSTLRRYQEEVDEVKMGIECGIRLGDFNDYEEGDVIECYLLERVEQTL